MYDLLERSRHATELLLVLFVVSLVVIAFVLPAIVGWPVMFGFPILAGIIVVVAVVYALGDRGIVSALRPKVGEHPLRAKANESLSDAGICMGMAAPALVLLDSSAMNAAATGHDPGRRVVITTTATVEDLDPRALRAVFAHEIAHIHSGDTSAYPIMTAAIRVGRVVLTAGLVAFFYGSPLSLRVGSVPAPSLVMLAGLLVVLPLTARLMQVAFMRTREYAADAAAALAVRDPAALARALVAMDERLNTVAGAGIATSHMFAMAPETLSRRPILEVHPPVAKRLERLRVANPSDEELEGIEADYMQRRALDLLEIPRSLQQKG